MHRTTTRARQFIPGSRRSSLSRALARKFRKLGFRKLRELSSSKLRWAFVDLYTSVVCIVFGPGYDFPCVDLAPGSGYGFCCDDLFFYLRAAAAPKQTPANVASAFLP